MLSARARNIDIAMRSSRKHCLAVRSYTTNVISSSMEVTFQGKNRRIFNEILFLWINISYISSDIKNPHGTILNSAFQRSDMYHEIDPLTLAPVIPEYFDISSKPRKLILRQCIIYEESEPYLP